MTKSKKELILEKSMLIILNEGVSKLTIKNIASKMGFVESAIYKHYSKKIDIIIDIISYIENICNNTLEKIEVINSNPIEKLYSYIDEWNNTYTEMPQLIPIFFSKELFKFDESIVNRIHSLLNKQTQLLDEIILCGQEEGYLNNNISERYLRLFIVSPWALLIDDWFYNGRNFSLNEHTKDLIDEMMKLLRNDI